MKDLALEYGINQQSNVILQYSPLSKLGVFAAKKFNKDEIVAQFHGKILSYPTPYSLQLDENSHIGPGDETTDYTNHTCEPNCRIDFQLKGLRALKNISKGDEITFNYLTTELELHSPFRCNCGFTNCFEEIRGFRFLPKTLQEKILPYVSPFLQKWFHKHHT